MWIINCVLIVIGTVAAVMGISFFLRNKQAAGNTRYYILLCGLGSAIWCIGYACIGMTTDLSQCGYIRKIGVFGIDLFMASEIFLMTELSGVRKGGVIAAKIATLTASVADFVLYSASAMDIFLRVDDRIIWYANPEYAYAGKYHTFYMVFFVLILLIFGIVWFRNSRLKRLRRFLALIMASNSLIFLFSIPDTFISKMGGFATPTSGIGAALCTIAMWYGAVQLNFYDIRTGNVKDRLFDFYDAGAVVFDSDRKVSLMNRYAERVAKDSRKPDLTLKDLFRIDEKDEERIFLSAVDDIYALRLTGYGENRTYSVRIRAVDDSYGELFCYMCVFMDITEEVASASRLQIASQAKTRFLAQMSHEIRTPINVVLGMNEMILRRSKEEEILGYSKNIDSAGNTLLSLINSILDLSKIEDGKMELNPVVYDLGSFINDMAVAVKQRAEGKGLAFLLDVDESLPTRLIGDDLRLAQVITNLLGNAVRYTEEGSIKLTFRPESRTENQLRLFISVSDTGTGIAEEDLKDLKASFEHAGERKAAEIESAGLGLSISTGILSLMGSSLQVESVLGEGSVFSFVVEQEIADKTDLGSFQNSQIQRERYPEDLISAPNARVLVVDDNELSVEVTKNLLNLCDIKPDLARSGEEAIRVLRDHTYDMILLDCMMPEMDGTEALHRIRKEHLILSHTAVIALTTNAVIGTRAKFLAAGFTDYLSKPIELKHLVQMLKNFLPEEAFSQN